MSTLIHDSRRSGKLGRVLQYIASGDTVGMILSPFDTPPVDQPRRPSAAQCVEAVLDAGGSIYLDPTTHGIGMPGANRFTIYDDWSFWSGSRGDLASDVAKRDHVERALAAQHKLGIQPVAPTVAVGTVTGVDAQTARSLAEYALVADATVYLSVVGSPTFWSQGRDLDDYIGMLNALRPDGWIVSVTRPTMTYPVPVDSVAEVAGLCRTVHSLSQSSPVIVAHGDLASLPAVAAGATGIGTGWDLRQRVLSNDSFIESDPDDVRRTGRRITHQGLLASLKRVEAERLRAGEGTLSDRLVPGALPIDMTEEWQGHVRALSSIVELLSLHPSRRDRSKVLADLYRQAAADFATAEPHARPLTAGSGKWVEPFLDGLIAYAIAEGWII